MLPLLLALPLTGVVALRALIPELFLRTDNGKQLLESKDYWVGMRKKSHQTTPCSVFLWKL